MPATSWGRPCTCPAVTSGGRSCGGGGHSQGCRVGGWSVCGSACRQRPTTGSQARHACVLRAQALHPRAARAPASRPHLCRGRHLRPEERHLHHIILLRPQAGQALLQVLPAAVVAAAQQDGPGSHPGHLQGQEGGGEGRRAQLESATSAGSWRQQGESGGPSPLPHHATPCSAGGSRARAGAAPPPLFVNSPPTHPPTHPPTGWCRAVRGRMSSVPIWCCDLSTCSTSARRKREQRGLRRTAGCEGAVRRQRRKRAPQPAHPRMARWPPQLQRGGHAPLRQGAYLSPAAAAAVDTPAIMAASSRVVCAPSAASQSWRRGGQGARE